MYIKLTPDSSKCIALECLNLSQRWDKFRHTKASHLYNNGTSLLYVKEFLGHSTITSTEIYATPDAKKQREEILKNSEIIKTKNKYNSDKIDDLNNWLKNNMK